VSFGDDLVAAMQRNSLKDRLQGISKILLHQVPGFLRSNNLKTYDAAMESINSSFLKFAETRIASGAGSKISNKKGDYEATEFSLHGGASYGGAGGSLSYTHRSYKEHVNTNENDKQLGTYLNSTSLELLHAENEIFERTKNIKDPNARAEKRAELIAYTLSETLGSVEYAVKHHVPAGVTNPYEQDNTYLSAEKEQPVMDLSSGLSLGAPEWESKGKEDKNE
jgi:hypothetical protein